MYQKIYYRPELAEKLEKVTNVVISLLEIDPRVVESSLANFCAKDGADFSDIGEMIRIIECHPGEIITAGNSGEKTAVYKPTEVFDATYFESVRRLYPAIKNILDEYREGIIMSAEREKPLTTSEKNRIGKVFSNLRNWLNWPRLMVGDHPDDNSFIARTFRDWSKCTRGDHQAQRA